MIAISKLLARFSLAWCVVCMLGLGACWLDHTYEECDRDEDCAETHRCLKQLCMLRPGLVACDPEAAQNCPLGFLCEPTYGYCFDPHDAQDVSD